MLVDGPSQKEGASVPRQSMALANLIITHLVIPKLPRAAGRGPVSKAWEKEGVEEKWNESAWAKRREQREKRRALTDFERFKVMKLRKQVGIYMFPIEGMPSFCTLDLGILYDDSWVEFVTGANLVIQARFEVRKSYAKVRASAKAT